MTKLAVAVAAVLLMASVSPNVALAAMSPSQAAIQGQAIDRCRKMEQPDANMREKHAHLARQACVRQLDQRAAFDAQARAAAQGAYPQAEMTTTGE